MPNAKAVTSNGSFARALFRERQLAERAFQAARELGYDATDINAIMTDRTREQLFSATPGSPLARKAGDKDAAPSGDEVGGPAGATVATFAPALAAVGTVLLIPGIVALGPFAVALTAAGAMGVGAGLVGALTHWGIPSKEIGEYEARIREGGILLAVKPRSEEDARRLIAVWTSSGGESVHS